MFGAIPQVFPVQGRGIERTIQRQNSRRGNRSHSTAPRARPYTPAGMAASYNLQGGCHELIWTRLGLHMGNVTGSVGAIPWLCLSKFGVQSGMRSRGCGAERTRPFEVCLHEGATAEARRPMRVCQDAPLLFPGDSMSSSGRGHTAILTNTHSRTTNLIKNDYLMIINGCFIA